HIRSADEPAIQCVGPPVILAAEDVFAAASERNRPCAVTAYITERPQHSRLVAHDDDRLSRYFRGEVGLSIRNRLSCPVQYPLLRFFRRGWPAAAGLVGRPYQLPGPPENLLPLNLKNLRVGIETRRQGMCALNLFVYIGVKSWGHVWWRPRSAMDII